MKDLGKEVDFYCLKLLEGKINLICLPYLNIHKFQNIFLLCSYNLKAIKYYLLFEDEI